MDVPEPAPDPDIPADEIESDPRFPSGSWRGFWLQTILQQVAVMPPQKSANSLLQVWMLPIRLGRCSKKPFQILRRLPN